MYGIFAHPVEHSLSPILYNAAFSELHMNAHFDAFDIYPKLLKYFFLDMRERRGLKLRGVAISLPHKEECMKYIDYIDKTAVLIGAVNTVKYQRGKLYGFNTDWIGVRDALLEFGSLKDKTVLIIGAGGAAKAATYACRKMGAYVVIINRTLEKAKEVADRLDARYTDFENLCSLNCIHELQFSGTKKDIVFDIYINATSVGMDEKLLPVQFLHLREGGIVFDLVYRKKGLTPWLQKAREQGFRIINGRRMLFYQALAQFEILTGKKAPQDAMERALMASLR